MVVLLMIKQISQVHFSLAAKASFAKGIDGKCQDLVIFFRAGPGSQSLFLVGSTARSGKFYIHIWSKNIK